MWDRIPVWTGPESAQKGTVAYQVLKVEKSIFSALELSPGGVSQNHMTDFLKTEPTRNLRGGTRHMSSGHEVRLHAPSATASIYASPQSRHWVSTFTVIPPLRLQSVMFHREHPRDRVTAQNSSWQESVPYLCDAGAPMGTSYGGYHEAYVQQLRKTRNCLAIM